MKLRRFTHYLLGHDWQAIALVFVCTLVGTNINKYVPNLPMAASLLLIVLALSLGLFAVTFATLVTLMKGAVRGFIFTAAATLPYLISIYTPGNENAAMSPLYLWIGVGVAVSTNLLTWVFAVMLRRQVSWSILLQIAALMGVLAVSVVHLVYPEIADWWGVQIQTLQQSANAMTEELKSAAPAANVPDAQLEAVNLAKQFATGLIAAVILLNAILQLVVARWWQATAFDAGSLKRGLHNIRLSPLAGVLFIASLILSYLGNSVVLDMMPILYALFAAAGLSLIHYLFGLIHSNSWFWLSLFYITLVLAWPPGIILVAMLAVFDIWFDVRKRIKKVY